MRIELPVANGIRTDHPVPNLPFIDDSHLPIHDGQAIEATGRHNYNDGWGRYDCDHTDERRWNACTDDQFNLSFAWLVRHDPGYGRTVLLYATGDTAIMHEHNPQDGDPLLHRAGGYWWDGKTWHRPAVIFDRSTDRTVVTPVPEATSITATEHLTRHPGNPDKGKLADITTFTPGDTDDHQWENDLALWASRRPEDGLPLDQCIVDVSAPELEPDALVSQSAAARELRLSRADIKKAINTSGGGRATRFPFPQRHTPLTRSPRWSIPVLREWMWERQRTHPEPMVEHLYRGHPRPDTDALLYTITTAVLWKMQQVHAPAHGYNLGLPLETMIGWIVSEQPHLAEGLFGEIARRARQELDVTDEALAQLLWRAVHWGTRTNTEDEQIKEFLRRTLPPSLSRHSPRSVSS